MIETELRSEVELLPRPLRNRLEGLSPVVSLFDLEEILLQIVEDLALHI